MLKYRSLTPSQLETQSTDFFQTCWIGCTSSIFAGF